MSSSLFLCWSAGSVLFAVCSDMFGCCICFCSCCISSRTCCIDFCAAVSDLCAVSVLLAAVSVRAFSCCVGLFSYSIGVLSLLCWFCPKARRSLLWLVGGWAHERCHTRGPGSRLGLKPKPGETMKTICYCCSELQPVFVLVCWIGFVRCVQ